MYREKMVNFIKNSRKGVKVGNIEKATGLNRNSIQKIIDQLTVEGLIELDRCHTTKF